MAKKAAKKTAKEDVGEQELVMLDLSLDEKQFTSYERARIIGSRALQIAQGAQPLIKLTKKQIEEIGYNPIEIAKREFAAGKVPLSVKRSLPHESKGPTER